MKIITTTRLDSYHKKGVSPLKDAVSELQSAMLVEQGNVDDLEGDVNTLKSNGANIVYAYIRSGSTVLTNDWLSETNNGTALTPATNKIYIVLSSGDYQNKMFRWNSTSSKYERVGLGEVQSKVATPRATQQTIVPDSGYEYLTQVTVAAIPYSETSNSAGGTTVTIG